jgi:hypothetical protein
LLKAQRSEPGLGVWKWRLAPECSKLKPGGGRWVSGAEKRKDFRLVDNGIYIANPERGFLGHFHIDYGVDGGRYKFLGLRYGRQGSAGLESPFHDRAVKVACLERSFGFRVVR